jgi:hypothetical protein
MPRVFIDTNVLFPIASLVLLILNWGTVFGSDGDSSPSPAPTATATATATATPT